MTESPEVTTKARGLVLTPDRQEDVSTVFEMEDEDLIEDVEAVSQSRSGALIDEYLDVDKVFASRHYDIRGVSDAQPRFGQLLA